MAKKDKKKKKSSDGGDQAKSAKPNKKTEKTEGPPVGGTLVIDPADMDHKIGGGGDPPI